MTRALRGLTALTLCIAGPLVAQQGPIADRMLDLQGKPAPEGTVCRLQGGDFRVTGAGTKLSTALQNSIPDNKRRLFAEGRDLSLQAIQGGQVGSSKAWYYLGRIYLQQGDLAGADSAFTRVVALAPGCASEVQLYRVRAWSTLISAAAVHRTAGRGDSAMVLAQAAGRIEPSRPQAWYTIGAYYLESQQNDSAAVYLARALASTGDSSANAITIRQAAAYQLAVVEFNAHDFQGAARDFGEAVRLKPEDMDAKRNLAASLRQAGMADSATKVEQSMMAAAAGSEGGLTVGQLFDIGVSQFNAGSYADAALTFEKIIAAEPSNRDALFNLAQSYKGAANADKLLETAQKLRAIDPLSFEVLQLMASGYAAKRDQPNVLKAVEVASSATISVRIASFDITAVGATLGIELTGREGRDLNDRVVRPAAIPLVVEFLDQAGTVVATTETILPVVAKDAKQSLSVSGAGAGITAWRYRRK